MSATQVKAPPRQVRKASDKAEEIQKKLIGSETPAEDIQAQADEDIDALLRAVEEPSAERQEAEPETEAEKPEEVPARPKEDWKQKYSVLRGKYDAEVPRLHEDIKGLQQNLMSMEERINTKQSEPEDLNVSKGHKYIQADEVEDYGSDFMDMIGRRAQEIAEDKFQPMVNGLQQDLNSLRTHIGNTEQRVGRTEQQNFYSQLDVLVKDWREVNTSANFLAWLGSSIPETNGLTRQSMLTEAFTKGDAQGVAAFFANYANQTGNKQENAQNQQGTNNSSGTDNSTLQMQNLVSPTAGQGNSQGAPANESSQKVWTRSEIQQFYKDSRDGKYSSRLKDKAKIEASIVKAANEGRVH